MIEEELKEIINSLKAINDNTSSIEIKSAKLKVKYSLS
jgi:hypothetical protein